MRLKDMNKNLQILNEYFENEGGLDFDFSNKLCDIIPEIEEQASKYNKMMNKFINEYYFLVEEGNENKNSYYKIKDINQIEFVLNEKSKIENHEFHIEKKNVSKVKTISPKVLLVLREFFVFVD